jgi:intracellular sulfur oxidation DsrE/DsrF family protein
MKRSCRTAIGSAVLAVILLAATAGTGFGEEYPALKGLKSVKAVFSFEIGNPQSALAHLQVIRQTYQDKNIRVGKKKPELVVVFYGPSVKLASLKRDAFSAADQKIVEEYAGTVSAMAKEGVKFEICLIAMRFAGVEPSTLLPEIKPVGNGWIAVIGYQARSYSLVPVK